ncbi:Band 7/SPFH domain-containing protein [Klebsormidium nitens]|uniref:Flotillin-like n=1 Tax=Klebsormidium nitens TaxID=105231 RepID=A0A0U9I6J9_KLENI|nr:Band 7/SPFH domain-containing protein [Klebsormidium nitens]|eukprot:GAQ80217.1 Band 7/SPFH domain-containing protein [Klebsormidium nitens]
MLLSRLVNILLSGSLTLNLSLAPSKYFSHLPGVGFQESVFNPHHHRTTMGSYRVASNNEFLVTTGIGIKDVRVSKKGWVFFGQKSRIFDVTPRNYTLELHAMTREKLEFLLPAVFTIGPKLEPQALHLYAQLLAGRPDEVNHITELVKGMIEGETRVLAANMGMEEIFNARKGFQTHVVEGVQKELDQFGLFIYNANIKELKDTAGSEYFRYMRMKTHEDAINKGKVDVANARYYGDVGEKGKVAATRRETKQIEAETVVYEKTREGEQRQAVQKVEAETIVYEKLRQQDIAQADAALQVKQATFQQSVQIAQTEARKAAEMRQMELDKQVEEKRLLAETERQRATLVSKAAAEAESQRKQADALLYTMQKEAEAAQYKTLKQAEGQLVAAQNQAKGALALAEAQAEGIQKVLAAFGGDTNAALQYIMVERGLYGELARANAEAVQGLNPKITVWNTGSETGPDGQPTTGSNPLRNIFQSLPPLFATIQDQTGIVPPAWLAKMPAQENVNH